MKPIIPSRKLVKDYLFNINPIIMTLQDYQLDEEELAIQQEMDAYLTLNPEILQ